MNPRFLLCLLITALLLCTCSDDAETPAANLPAAALDVLVPGGGVNALLNWEYSASGIHHDATQSRAPCDDQQPFAGYEVTQYYNITGNQLRQDWTRLPGGPDGPRFIYTETMDFNAERGWIQGRYTVASSHENQNLPAKHLAFTRKRLLLSSPHLLLREAVTNPAGVTDLGLLPFEGADYRVLSISSLTQQPIRLFLHPEFLIPRKTDTMENTWSLGDSLVEVLFDGWGPADNLLFPFLVEHRLAGKTMQLEQRSAAKSNGNQDEGLFVIPPADQIPEGLLDPFEHDAERGRWEGDLRSNIMTRYIGNFTLIYSVLDHDLLAQDLNLDQPILPGVYHLLAVTHGMAVIEMADFLVLSGAPISNQLNKVLVGKIKAKFPNKPIRYVMVGHPHDDHIGGLRTLMAEGATIVVARDHADRIQKMHTAPYTLHPDGPAPPQALDLLVVDQSHVITDGIRNLELHVVDTAHTESNMLLWVEDVKLLYTDDSILLGFFNSGDFGPDPTLPIPSPFIESNLHFWNNVLPQLNLNPDWILGGHGVLGSREQMLEAFDASDPQFVIKK